MRETLKRGGEVLLCRSRLPAISRTFRRADVLVLAYHNVVPEGEPVAGDRSLHLHQRTFARQLDVLLRTHDVVPLESLASAAAGGRRPRVVITFDDAYQGAVTAGVEELRRRGLPATIFVAPHLLGGRSFWWDVLAPPGEATLPSALRADCLSRCRGIDADVRRWAAEAGIPLREVPAHQTGATEEQLTQAVRGGGITLAAHTWSHPNLPTLDAGELEMELTRPLEWLRQRFRTVLPWLSYPYGLSSPSVEAAVERCGYVGAFRVEGGWMARGHSSARSPFTLPRLNIPSGVSLPRFELNTSGVLVR